MSQNKSSFLKRKSHGDEEVQWLSVSDLMSGLMMVFLFISIALMRNAFLERDKVQIEKDKIKYIALAYQKNQGAIYDGLMEEFEQDLDKWGADIDKDTLSFVFTSPDVLFASGDIAIRPQFKAILNDFFPRYLNVLLKFSDSIDEARIEGHTSSIWNSGTTVDAAYFKNMWLSQGRTRSVLQYVYLLKSIRNNKDWVKKHISAVGFSSSKVVMENGVENHERSRRVTFRVITNAETQIRQIIEGV
ncbi:conserved hypothetical protein [Bathymodiolus platifrons methanotrophic gill symbiont]|uniref:OmpA family protein n=1 Tax=Bathymodiolus platifrons methanotrophic gill symbiont TaxID=113268 RepID=UPI000B41F5C9|nr:OmpA family protein [Bathymodiolus platifrons methanotrophic gill symbiont]GAW86184.1 conserved hypothetical protein [Bathymodiolus platifrons methanotrophic gill symbiont]GFO76927.1 hypothetical protein BPLS_P5035 [Bathymodiolus platifrons methanotrophic gill symbiont]